MRSVELFSGCGGLALGTSLAGFRHEILVEWNKHACVSLRENAQHRLAHGWRVHEGDIRRFDFTALKPDIDLLAGGPPCQPFSIGGKHKGHADERNLFPEYFRAVRTLQPKALLIENVRGLTRRAFADFFQYIKLSLTYPEVAQQPDETWETHYARLRNHDHDPRKTAGLHYHVQIRLINAADYGAPQERWRVFFVGFRHDVDVPWSFPAATHSAAELYREQVTTGAYWTRHHVPKAQRRLPAEPSSGAMENGAGLLPWRTVRDALAGLPEPHIDGSAKILNHIRRNGAKAYAGHTGSALDEPSKALKAGVHGVPGGENMLAHPDGSVRYYTIREAARIQTFPDDYAICGAWGEGLRQLGNAVPVVVAETVARSISQGLQSWLAARPSTAGAVKAAARRTATAQS